MAESIAEKEGMSFSDRCAFALDCLTGLSSLIGEFAQDELLMTQAKDAKDEAAFSKLSPAAREVVGPMVAALDGNMAENNASFRAGLWAQGLAFTRDAYGADETELALATMRRRRPGN